MWRGRRRGTKFTVEEGEGEGCWGVEEELSVDFVEEEVLEKLEDDVAEDLIDFSWGGGLFDWVNEEVSKDDEFIVREEEDDEFSLKEEVVSTE